jgi:two-component system cell cycle sensor histidine kinase/response regulator CckA
MKSEVVKGLAGAGWPVLLTDPAGAILNANPAAARAFGPAVTGTSASLGAIWLAENDASPADFLVRCQRAPATLLPLKLLGDGGVPNTWQAAICALSDGAATGFLLQFLPAAPESKGTHADNNQAQKQKLDCALQLARTVSLDFNNALTSILGHTSLILSKIEPGNPWRNSLLEVEKSAARAAEIANDLAAFSRPEKEARVQASGNLNQLLQRNVELFQSTKLDKEVTWSLQLERRLYSARFDEAKLQQALVKIMENAIEALAPRGRITLYTKNLDLTQPTQDRNAQLAAGSYVCAEISDDGCGIETEVLPRIFEPFFTTKRASKHRGLGLAWVYGIVTNHGGGVAVSSQAGVGTSVRVYLPADKRFVKEEVIRTADLTGTQTILMVDDEDLLLTMGETVLSTYGYKVLTANSGPKALEIITHSDRPIDLVITDLVMPNMSGRELVEHVRKLSPATKILSSSGYVRPAEEQEQAAYLQKPFTSQDLLLKVKQALAIPAVD